MRPPSLQTHLVLRQELPPPGQEVINQWDLVRWLVQNKTLGSKCPTRATNDQAIYTYILVGGWTNPFETYARQIGSFSQVGDENKKCLKPPSSILLWFGYRMLGKYSKKKVEWQFTMVKREKTPNKHIQDYSSLSPSKRLHAWPFIHPKNRWPHMFFLQHP